MRDKTLAVDVERATAFLVRGNDGSDVVTGWFEVGRT